MSEYLVGELHEVIKELAYEYWEERGRPIGSRKSTDTKPSKRCDHLVRLRQ
jgi:hypothetical protein